MSATNVGNDYLNADCLNRTPAEEIYLLTANIEATLEDYLLNNGVMIDPATRTFLASMRDAMGAASRRAKMAIGTASKG